MARNNRQKGINQLHDEGLILHFIRGIGKKVIVMSPSYPFLFIGKIMGVADDIVEIFVETTHFAQLEDRSWFIHIDNIEVFYIERAGGIPIPQLDDIC